MHVPSWTICTGPILPIVCKEKIWVRLKTLLWAGTTTRELADDFLLSNFIVDFDVETREDFGVIWSESINFDYLRH